MEVNSSTSRRGVTSEREVPETEGSAARWLPMWTPTARISLSVELIASLSYQTYKQKVPIPILSTVYHIFILSLYYYCQTLVSNSPALPCPCVHLCPPNLPYLLPIAPYHSCFSPGSPTWTVSHAKTTSTPSITRLARLQQCNTWNRSTLLSAALYLVRTGRFFGTRCEVAPPCSYGSQVSPRHSSITMSICPSTSPLYTERYIAFRHVSINNSC